MRNETFTWPAGYFDLFWPHALGLNVKYEHKEKRFVSGEKVELKKVDVVSLSSSEVIGKSRENLMVPLKDD